MLTHAAAWRPRFILRTHRVIVASFSPIFPNIFPRVLSTARFLIFVLITRPIFSRAEISFSPEFSPFFSQRAARFPARFEFRLGFLFREILMPRGYNGSDTVRPRY